MVRIKNEIRAAILAKLDTPVEEESPKKTTKVDVVRNVKKTMKK